MSDASAADPDTVVEDAFVNRLDVARDALSEDAALEADLGVESLDLVEIAEAIEADLGVHVPDDELARFETVGDLEAYVRDEHV
jgi:acyl carrier protein